ncbi:DPH3 homolog [Folsomia candida]|uniref:DPH3 homolog n=1 Tax=Folsomia candida TaxID=158441 RepID=UPI001605197C|nr:DPH3 homolog [Folsomia candida]
MSGPGVTLDPPASCLVSFLSHRSACSVASSAAWSGLVLSRIEDDLLIPPPQRMTSYYDEVEIEDFEWDEDSETYFYPCPCGDRFLITKEELINGEDVATCPSCSLLLKVIYDPEQFAAEEEECGRINSACATSLPRCAEAQPS